MITFSEGQRGRPDFLSLTYCDSSGYGAWRCKPCFTPERPQTAPQDETRLFYTRTWRATAHATAQYPSAQVSVCLIDFLVIFAVVTVCV